jgi:hypothetical protein
VNQRVLIGSVFAGDSPAQERWLALQLASIRATTGDFHHVTFLPSNAGAGSRFAAHDTEILPNAGDTSVRGGLAHLLGLRSLLEYFRAHNDEYSMFLFLDSDAFPIRRNWLPLLCQRMAPEAEIAIAIRTENLEQRLHSSILLATRGGLDNLSFEVGVAGLDLIGHQEHDLMVPFYQQAHRERVFALVRSNQTNVHPLLCGIYFDSFYHHGCGSGREFIMRAQPYWEHAVAAKADVEALTQRLMADPGRFVRRLAGWRPEAYAPPDFGSPVAR